MTPGSCQTDVTVLNRLHVLSLGAKVYFHEQACWSSASVLTVLVVVLVLLTSVKSCIDKLQLTLGKLAFFNRNTHSIVMLIPSP